MKLMPDSATGTSASPGRNCNLLMSPPKHEFEIRNPKLEIRNTGIELTTRARITRLSDFGIRISSLCFRQADKLVDVAPQDPSIADLRGDQVPEGVGQLANGQQLQIQRQAHRHDGGGH